jgi:hypothetical protein
LHEVLRNLKAPISCLAAFLGLRQTYDVASTIVNKVPKQVRVSMSFRPIYKIG